MRWIRTALIASVLLTMGVSTSYLQEGLADRVQQLEHKVHSLQTKVATLERLVKPKPGVPAGKAAWRQLRMGMSEDDVRKLLGEPKTVSAYESFIQWGYGQLSFVQFSADTRQVKSWGEPR